jgi:hypothetical protein
MSLTLKVALLLALLVAAAQAQLPGAGVRLGPTYTLQNYITVDNSADRNTKNFSRTTANAAQVFSHVEYFEWESYDGWFNNPAHPEWGGAGKPYNPAGCRTCITMGASLHFFPLSLQTCLWKGRHL